ncbi:hypothetical protein EHM92_04120 [bacterium]|nr:MAG: hypothetical protein EHM92_04120 [bacterium]
MTTIEEFRQESWRLHPSLDFEDLFPPAVLFAVFESDPRPKFKDHLTKILGELEKQASASSAADLQDVKQARLSASWDWVFREIPGDQVGLLLPVHGQVTGASRSHAEGQPLARVYSIVIGSTSPPGTKWLVTRATRYKQRPVCWCLPINVQKGKVSEVSLSRGNMTELETL